MYAERFGIPERVLRPDGVRQADFLSQLDRCYSDAERRLILGCTEKEESK
jgi:hypothetical protein